jgi:hypothetical protein
MHLRGPLFAVAPSITNRWKWMLTDSTRMGVPCNHPTVAMHLQRKIILSSYFGDWSLHRYAASNVAPAACALLANRGLK